MSERLRGRLTRPHEVTVVTVGDCGVGKTALINRFCEDKFVENYIPSAFSRHLVNSSVAGRRVRYTFWDTSGARTTPRTPANTPRTLAIREADVFLLCYKISDPATLFSAINHWVPELTYHAPSTPIVLVVCQADLRSDQRVRESLANAGKAPVSAKQALSMSQQIEAVMYVETSAKTSSRSVASVMEVATLTSLGQFTSPLETPISSLPPSPLVSKKLHNRSLSVPRQQSRDLQHQLSSTVDSLRESRESLPTLESSEVFWDQLDSQALRLKGSLPSPVLQLRSSSKTGSLSSGSLRSKSSTLSSTRSDSSTKGIIYPSTQSPIRSVNTKGKGTKGKEDQVKSADEKMVTITCQRLTADKTYEEVEIEVPSSVYETLQNSNEGGREARLKQGTEKRGGFGTKIKCLFSKTAQ